MNILLFGKTGQVGWELRHSLITLGNFVAFNVESSDCGGNVIDLIEVTEAARFIKSDIFAEAVTLRQIQVRR